MYRLAGIAAMFTVLGCDSEFNIPVDPEAGIGAPNPRPPENPINEDRIVQTIPPLVDVLFVIDNSCSMADDQDQLAQNLPPFMAYFEGSGLDYHIGAVSTDMDARAQSGKLQGSGEHLWVDVDTPRPVEVFSNIVRMGDRGSADERGREAAYTALVLEADAANAGFVRREAAMHIIVVSDEPDFSRDRVITRDEFVSLLQGARPTEDMVSFNSIVLPPGERDAGLDYLYITDQVGGLKRDIRSDWRDMMEDLGLQAAGLKREYFLSQVPEPGTVEVAVTIDGVVSTFFEGTDWSYDERRNSILFSSFVPPELAVVQVRYTLLGSRLTIVD